MIEVWSNSGGEHDIRGRKLISKALTVKPGSPPMKPKLGNQTLENIIPSFKEIT
jgi:hypothetical protein